VISEKEFLKTAVFAKEIFEKIGFEKSDF